MTSKFCFGFCFWYSFLGFFGSYFLNFLDRIFWIFLILFSNFLDPIFWIFWILFWILFFDPIFWILFLMDSIFFELLNYIFRIICPYPSSLSFILILHPYTLSFHLNSNTPLSSLCVKLFVSQPSGSTKLNFLIFRVALILALTSTFLLIILSW